MPHALSDFSDHRVTVRLPDLSMGFLVADPVVSPWYDTVRLESEDWLRSIMSLSPQQHKRVNRINFSYFCAVMMPHAPREKLKLIFDWGNWVFPFDDMFDEGELTNDPDASQRIINDLLSTMLPGIERSADEPIVLAHDNIYRRLAACSSPSVVARYVKATQSYGEGLLQHVDDHVSDRIPTVQDVLDTRILSVGAFPMYPLVEFAYDLDIPDEVFVHPTVQTLEKLGAELTMLWNDMFSYRKEEVLQDCTISHNLVALCRLNGMSAQEAFDVVALMVDERFTAWDETLKAVPSWGEAVDAQVKQYIRGIQDMVQANLSWSFQTGRYFGSEVEKVRQFGKIDVLVQPSFLSADVTTDSQSE